MIIITPNQMREIEKLAELEFGLTSSVLVKRAASAILEVLQADYENLQVLQELHIFFAVGPGNNGKDALELAKRLGMSENKYPLESCDIVIDGLFGTDLNRDISGENAELIEKINNSGLPVYAIDIPSGVDGLTGKIHGKAIKAFKTITFFGCKPGLLFGDGKNCAGQVIVKDLEIQLSEKISAQVTIGHARLDNKIFARRMDSNKGTFGRVVCVAGSTGMRGAPALCAMGAFATGAGLVYVATTEKVWNTVSTVIPEAVGIMLNENAEGGISSKNLERLIKAAQEADVVIVGPGMTKCQDTSEIVKRLMKEVDTPFILDADALNSICAKDIAELQSAELQNAKLANVAKLANREILVTPHLVELERLSGTSKNEILSDRLRFVKDFSTSNKCVTLFKGAGTVICSPLGEISINTNGNPGMAVAGSGDVLAGMIAGLVAQGLSLYEAACGGAFLHGLAGDLAAEKKGFLSLLPSDIVKYISKACLSLENPVCHLKGGEKRRE